MPPKKKKTNKKKNRKTGVASRSQIPEEPSVSTSPTIGNINSSESTIQIHGASESGQSEKPSSDSESDSPTPVNESQTIEVQEKQDAESSESAQETKQQSNAPESDSPTPTNKIQSQTLAQDVPITVEKLESFAPELNTEETKEPTDSTENSARQSSQTSIPPPSAPIANLGPPLGLDGNESPPPLFTSPTSNVAGPSAVHNEGLSPRSTVEGEDSDSVNSAIVSAMERVEDPDEKEIEIKDEEKEVSPTKSPIEFDSNNPLGIMVNETSYKGFDALSRDPTTGSSSSTSPNLSEQSIESDEKKSKDMVSTGQSGIEISQPSRDLVSGDSGSHVQKDSISPIPKIIINESPDPPSNSKDLSALHNYNYLNSKEEDLKTSLSELCSEKESKRETKIEEIPDMNDTITAYRLEVGLDPQAQGRETKPANSPRDSLRTTSSMTVETSDLDDDNNDDEGQHGGRDIYIASGNEGQMDNAPFEDLTSGQTRPPIQGTSSSRGRQDEAAGPSTTTLTFTPQLTTAENSETQSESSLRWVPEEQPDNPIYKRVPLPDPQTNRLPEEHQEAFANLVATLEHEAQTGRIQSENGEVSYDGFNFYIEWGTRYQYWDINVSHRPAGKQRSDREFWPAMRLVRRLFGDERLKYHLRRWLESDYNVFGDNRLPRFENEVDRREFEPLLRSRYQFMPMARREETTQPRNEQQPGIDSSALKSPKSPKSEKSDNTASTESSLGSPRTKYNQAVSMLDLLTEQRSLLRPNGKWTEENEDEYMDACNKMERARDRCNREAAAAEAAESNATQPITPTSIEPGLPESQEATQSDIDDAQSGANAPLSQAGQIVSPIRNEPGSPDSQATVLPIINDARPIINAPSTYIETQKPAAFSPEQIDQLQQIQSELDMLQASENSLEPNDAPYELLRSRAQRKAELKGEKDAIYSSISKAGTKSWKENLFRQKWDALEKEQDELEEEKRRCEGISSKEQWTKEDRLREVHAQLDELANEQSSSSDANSPRPVYPSPRARPQVAPASQGQERPTSAESQPTIAYERQRSLIPSPLIPEHPRSPHTGVPIFPQGQAPTSPLRRDPIQSTPKVPLSPPRLPPFASPSISAIPRRLGAARPPPSAVQNDDLTPQPLNISPTKRPRPLRVSKEKSPAPSRHPTTQDAIKEPMEDPLSPRSHGPQQGSSRANETATPNSGREKKSGSPKKSKSPKKSPLPPRTWRGYLLGFLGGGASPANLDDSDDSGNGQSRLDFNAPGSDAPPGRSIFEKFETMGQPYSKSDFRAEDKESEPRGRTQERGGGRRENPVDASRNEMIDTVAPHHEHFQDTNVRSHTDIQLPPVQYFGQEGPDPLHERADTSEEEAEARLRILDQAEQRISREKINPRRTTTEVPDSVWLFMRGLPRRGDIAPELREEIQEQFEHLRDAANRMMVDRVEEHRKRVEAEAAWKECEAGRSGKAAEKVQKNKWDEQLQKKDDQIEELRKKLAEAREYGRAQEERAEGEKERSEREMRVSEREIKARQVAEALAQNLRNERAAQGTGRKESQRSVQRASDSRASGIGFDSHYASTYRSPGRASDQLRSSSLNLGRKPPVSSEVAARGKYHRRTISLILNHHISSLAPFMNRERWSIAQKRVREIYNFWHELPDDDPKILDQGQQNGLLGRVYFWIGVLEWRERRNQQAWQNFEHAGRCMGEEQCQEAEWLDVYRAQLTRERQTNQENRPFAEMRFVNTADSTPDLSGLSRPSGSS